MKRLLCIVLLAAVVTGLFSGCRYEPPEGFTKEHHTYEEIVAFAKSLDPNATVSEEYTDTVIDGWDRKFREWPAVINGIACHVSSVGDMVWNSGFLAGEFARQYYVIDTDYDYLLLRQIVAETQPEWKMHYDSIDSRYNWNGLISVLVCCTEERKLTDDELETVWQTMVQINTAYQNNPVRKEAWFSIPLPKEHYDESTETYYWKMDDSVIVNEFTEKAKSEFLAEYHEKWALAESERPVGE